MPTRATFLRTWFGTRVRDCSRAGFGSRVPKQIHGKVGIGLPGSAFCTPASALARGSELPSTKHLKTSVQQRGVQAPNSKENYLAAFEKPFPLRTVQAAVRSMGEGCGFHWPVSSAVHFGGAIYCKALENLKRPLRSQHFGSRQVKFVSLGSPFVSDPFVPRFRAPVAFRHVSNAPLRWGRLLPQTASASRVLSGSGGAGRRGQKKHPHPNQTLKNEKTGGVT